VFSEYNEAEVMELSDETVRLRKLLEKNGIKE
jgi:hypothetical protein